MKIKKPVWLFVQVLGLSLLFGSLVNATPTSAEACWQCNLSGSVVSCAQGGDNAVCYIQCGSGSICSCTSGGGTC